jgi:hypothetical protein
MTTAKPADLMAGGVVVVEAAAVAVAALRRSLVGRGLAGTH